MTSANTLKSKTTGIAKAAFVALFRRPGKIAVSLNVAMLWADTSKCDILLLAPVIQKLDSAIHWIKHYLADK